MDAPSRMLGLAYPFAVAGAAAGLGIMVTVAALGGHSSLVPASTREMLHEILCQRGSALDCGIAAGMLREGAPEHGDLVHAVVLGALARQGFDPATAADAREAAEQLEREPERAASPTQAAELRERACVAGDHVSCRMLARRLTALTTGERPAALPAERTAWRVASLLQLACEGGDFLMCEEADAARRTASR